MSIEKYLITIEQTVLALRYDDDKRLITIGGNFRFRSVMECIINEGFDRHPAGFPLQTQKNKIRFTFKKDREGFVNGIEWLRGNGYSVEPVTKHGNIMR